MSQVRKLAVAGGTFSVALGIGFVMQNGDALAARMGGPVPAGAQGAIEVPVMPAVAQSTVMPAVPDIAPQAEVVEAEFTPPTDLETPALPQVTVEMASQEAVELPAVEDQEFTQIVLPPVDENFIGPLLATQTRTQTASADCTATLDAATGPAATVTLNLSAPCAPNTTVTFHHHGMMFSAVTDAAGMATVTAPALAETAVFIADIGGAEGAVSVLTVSDAAMYDRSVLQWQGDTGFELHALEFGAGYQDDGHVWHASARTAASAMSGDGGYMMQLGDPRVDAALIAQVYTYPSGNSRLSGDIDLTVEAEITSANCGREMAAQSIQIIQGAEPVARDLEMTMPACDAVGEILVLNNMLMDLTLASR